MESTSADIMDMPVLHPQLPPVPACPDFRFGPTLGLQQAIIKGLVRKQLLGRTVLCNPTLVNDENSVEIKRLGYVVADTQESGLIPMGTGLCQKFPPLTAISSPEGLIQQDKVRPRLHEGPTQPHALAFATGEKAPALSENLL